MFGIFLDQIGDIQERVSGYAWSIVCVSIVWRVDNTALLM